MKKAAIIPGDRIIADGGFTCLTEGDIREVKTDEHGGEMFIECSEGRHYLDGQYDGKGNYIGLSLTEKQLNQ